MSSLTSTIASPSPAPRAVVDGAPEARVRRSLEQPHVGEALAHHRRGPVGGGVVGDVIARPAVCAARRCSRLEASRSHALVVTITTSTVGVTGRMLGAELDAAPMSAPRALVTGAAGFIGSHVVDGCLEPAWRSSRPTTCRAASARTCPRARAGSRATCGTPTSCAVLWADGRFDYVYHLGAYAAEGLSHFIRAFNYRTNLEASVNLVNQAVLHDAERFVFTSSIAVYGRGPGADDRGAWSRSRRTRTGSPSTRSSSTSPRRTRCSGSSTRSSARTTCTASARTSRTSTAT